MPRKFLKRWSPDPNALKSSSRLRFLGVLLHDPNLFHLTRHSVSSAFFIGLVICFLPIPVGHIPLVAVASLWFRCNLPIAFALVMISNPLTFPFIYYAAYILGCWILQIPIEAFHFHASWAWFKSFFLEAWKPFVIGTLTIGLVSGGFSYCIIQWVWRWQVISRWRTRKHKNRSKKKDFS